MVRGDPHPTPIRKPASNLNLANLLSISRLLILPFFLLAVVYLRPGLGLALLVVAGLTDILDGIIARWLDQTTTFGEYIDPATDKLLAAVGFIVLTLNLGYANRVPVWLTILIFARDLFISVGTLCIYLATWRTCYPATALGRIHSTVAVITLGLFLLHNALGASSLLIPVAVWATLVTTLASGFHYAYLAYLMTLPSTDTESDAESNVGTAS